MLFLRTTDDIDGHLESLLQLEFNFSQDKLYSKCTFLTTLDDRSAIQAKKKKREKKCEYELLKVWAK